MDSSNTNSTKFQTLRDKTKKIYSLLTPEERKPVYNELNKLIREIELYQNELEIQNEELKTTQETLKELSDRFFDLYDSAPVGYISFNLNGQITQINKTAATMLGFERDHILKAGFDKFVEEKDTEKFNRHRSKVISTGQKQETEVTLIDRTNSKKIFSLESAPEKNADGRIAGCRTILVDITDKRRLEEKINEANKLEALGTMAGGIAHDFNNILSIIIGNAELALSGYSEGFSIQNNLRSILNATARTRDLIKQILIFNRMDDHVKLDTDLGLMINEMTRMVRATLPTTIEIEAKIENRAFPILADPVQMQQLFINLCNNASAAIGDAIGRLEIMLQCRSLTEPPVEIIEDFQMGDYACLTVKDNGKGINASIIGKIFDPFFTTRESGEGTGMGLAVVHGIVKGHNGYIKVESEPEIGTSFNVYLPLIHTISKDKAGGDDSDLYSSGHENIMVVDDEPALVDVLTGILEALGYRVEGFVSSEEALEEFLENPDKYDIVITDYTMPKMAGDKLAKKMLDRRSNIPIVLCTGHSDWVSDKYAKQIGIREFALKPLSKRDLGEMVKRVLKH